MGFGSGSDPRPRAAGCDCRKCDFIKSRLGTFRDSANQGLPMSVAWRAETYSGGVTAVSARKWIVVVNRVA